VKSLPRKALGDERKYASLATISKVIIVYFSVLFANYAKFVDIWLGFFVTLDVYQLFFACNFAFLVFLTNGFQTH
jgi:hypothetical protein